MCYAPLKAKAHLGKVQKAQVDMFLLQKAPSIIMAAFCSAGEHLPRTYFIVFYFKDFQMLSHFWFGLENQCEICLVCFKFKYSVIVKTKLPVAYSKFYEKKTHIE